MKILFVVKNLRIANGVSSYLMNYYRKLINKHNIQLDFLVVSDVGSPYYDEIKSNGGNIYLLPSFKNPFKYISYLRKVFKKNNYDILHSNVINSNALISFVAMIYGVKVRILHSHATSNGDKLFKVICNIPFHFFSIINSNKFFACSELAGKKILWGKSFKVIRNAIDVKKFSFSDKNREYLRKKNNIEDKTIVIGVVGRITHVKNPYFILKIASELKEKSVDFKLWWLGSGDMDSEIKDEIIKANLDKDVVLFGSVSDIYKYYSAMDCFLLPSFHEGLPVVGVEAQASGLKCLLSDRITSEASLSKYTEFLSIDDVETWVEKIIKCKDISREKMCKNVDLSNYSIDILADVLYEEYEKFLRR